MIFRPELAKLILQGRKTQTRRTGPTCRYHAGKSYAMQPGRGKPASARITVVDVRQEPLGEISLRDVRREGFVTSREFFDYWQSLYDSVDRDQLVWVISFVLGDQTDTPRLLAARPGAPHGDYVSQSYLALEDAGEALSQAEQEHYSKLARVRDADRESDPARQSRDRLVKELATLRASVPANSVARNTVRRLEKELKVLERQLAA